MKKMPTTPNLPEDVIIQNILPRLPAKTVGRFRSVSKRWRALLSELTFIRAHLDHTKNTHQESLILCSESRKYVFHVSNAHHLFDEMLIFATRLSFATRSGSWFGVISSCDGLLLVADSVASKWVLNPLTRESKAIPRGPFVRDLDTFLYKLGYDSVADDYKVVALDTDSMGQPSDVYVYSLKMGAWKKAGNLPYHGSCWPDSGVFVGGYFHWLARTTTDHRSTVVVFDLMREMFGELSPPRSMVDDYDLDNNELAVLGGRLCMFDRKNTDLWVMMEYGKQESWTKFKISDPRSWPLCLLGEARVVMSKIEEQFVMDRGRFAACNMRGLKDTEIIRDSSDLYIDTGFVESLISPHPCRETGGE